MPEAPNQRQGLERLRDVFRTPPQHADLGDGEPDPFGQRTPDPHATDAHDPPLQADEAILDATTRIESAIATLAHAVPDIDRRLASLERAGDERPKATRADPDAVAGDLKGRLARVARECDRLADAPIERLEARVEAAEARLTDAIERAERATEAAAERERAAAAQLADLRSLADALAPWGELLTLCERVDGLPRPMAHLLSAASESLGGSMDALAGRLDQLRRSLDAVAEPVPAPARSASGGKAAPAAAAARTPKAGKDRAGEPAGPSRPGGKKAARKSTPGKTRARR